MSIVEGRLDRYHCKISGTHDTLPVKLDRNSFEYSNIFVTAALHNSASPGGPIHADSKMRVAFVGNDVVRLDVQQHAYNPAPDFLRTN